MRLEKQYDKALERLAYGVKRYGWVSDWLNTLRIRHCLEHRAGPYWLDLFIPSAGLCVEFDDKGHEKKKEYDIRRSSFLISKGFVTRVIRFSYTELITKPEEIKELIWLYSRSKATIRHRCKFCTKNYGIKHFITPAATEPKLKRRKQKIYKAGPAVKAWIEEGKNKMTGIPLHKEKTVKPTFNTLLFL